jgi:dTDP-L-rhamnose 4-epimerase
MRVLITGGAGFIGSYVADALLAKGYQVLVLDNLDPQIHGENRQWPSYLNAAAERQLGDVRDRQAVAAALDGCQAVVHLAGAVGVGQSMYDIERYCSVNVLGTAVLLEEVIKRKAGIRKVLVASSMSVYGEGSYQTPRGERVAPLPRPAEQLKRGQWDFQDPDGRPWSPLATREDKPLRPSSVYAVNKRDQEEMSLSVGRCYEIPVVALRMWNVYGPRQALSNPYTGVAAIFCARMMNAQPPLVFEDGKQMRDFVQVEDIAQAYVEALQGGGGDGMALNVGSGHPISITEIARTLAGILKVDLEPQITGRHRDGDIRHCFPDITLIQSRLNWRPKHRFDAEGVGPLVEWLKGQHPEDHVSDAIEGLRKRGLLK